ncbi:GDSL esterase/lipase EXL3-like [Rhodamnia argentea]|uniref:GDSL esterase/lipase EXL3-like n=1 Tax=Rhodamnia argentea TaxID=178133 RepID=A0A8B8NXG0_9MYRT|nr:GDSL esterase/lipase EXL3-like [Rhodamnia argentea]
MSSSELVRSPALLSAVFVLSVSVTFLPARAVVKLPPNETVPAVIVFGDSIVDAGNNNNMLTLVKCDFPPYGEDFQGGISTGRFCDGKVPSDLMAEQLGIKDTVPAYLDPNLQNQDLVTGVTFASGGSGYDPLTPKLVSVISMSDQLGLFKEYIVRLKGFVGEEKANFILAKSLYMVVSGSDDIANNYFTARVRQLQYDVPGYTDLMVGLASNFLQDLYDLGARRIAVFSAPPIGCVPSQRTLAGGAVRGCAEEHNAAAQSFNTKLSSKIDSLNGKLPHSKMVYIDVYNPLLDLIKFPQKHGFMVADKGCCGTGNIEVAILCNKLTPSTCTDVSDYVFWDSYHPTEKAYKTLVAPLITKYLNKFF